MVKEWLRSKRMQEAARNERLSCRQQFALFTSLDMGVPYKAIKRIYSNLRLAIVRECERKELHLKAYQGIQEKQERLLCSHQRYSGIPPSNFSLYLKQME